MPGPTEIREAITALEIRRVELEALIAQDLERRLFSDTEEISEILTNPLDVTPESTDSPASVTRSGSHFSMCWFVVSTS